MSENLFEPQPNQDILRQMLLQRYFADQPRVDGTAPQRIPFPYDVAPIDPREARRIQRQNSDSPGDADIMQQLRAHLFNERAAATTQMLPYMNRIPPEQLYNHMPNAAKYLDEQPPAFGNAVRRFRRGGPQRRT